VQRRKRILDLLLAVGLAVSLPVVTFLVARSLLALYWDKDRELEEGACIGCGFLLLFLTGVALVAGIFVAARVYRGSRRP
jgi:hypothetical protein